MFTTEPKRRKLLRQNLDPGDFRILHLRSERNVQFPISDLGIDGFDVSALCSAALHPDVEIFKILSLNIEPKYQLPRPRNAVKGFRQAKLDDVFAVRKRVRESSHAVSLGLVDFLVLRVGDGQIGPLYCLAIGKALVCKPGIPFGIRNGTEQPRLDANWCSCRSWGSRDGR